MRTVAAVAREGQSLDIYRILSKIPKYQCTGHPQSQALFHSISPYGEAKILGIILILKGLIDLYVHEPAKKEPSFAVKDSPRPKQHVVEHVCLSQAQAASHHQTINHNYDG